jgi:hypothetical protein
MFPQRKLCRVFSFDLDVAFFEGFRFHESKFCVSVTARRITDFIFQIFGIVFVFLR